MRNTRVIKRCALLVIIGVAVWQLLVYYNSLSGQRLHTEHHTINLHRVRNKTTQRTHPRLIEMPILLWWDSVYTNVNEIRQCGQYKCRVTNKKTLKDNLDTLVSRVFIFSKAQACILCYDPKGQLVLTTLSTGRRFYLSHNYMATDVHCEDDSICKNLILVVKTQTIIRRMTTGVSEFIDTLHQKAFLFYGSNFKPYNLPLPRRPHHLWALMHEESPRNVYVLNHSPVLSVFNFTSSYSLHSDYPITTQWLQCPNWLQDNKFVLPLVDKNRLRKLGLAPILYLQSDCGVPSDRDSFVKLLQKYIPVDSYGACLNNKKMPPKLRFHDNMAPLDDIEFFRFAARYKFTLAMENYVCNDYITEKLWRPLRLGSIPIVFGAPNIKEYLPANRSAIVIDDFEDVEDLAQYIHYLDTHDKLYKSYLTYKEEPLENEQLSTILNSRDWLPGFCNNKKGQSDKFKAPEHNLHNSIFTGFECFLCEQVHEYIKSGYRHRYKVKSTDYQCPSPRKFDENGRYSVHNQAWSAEWAYGKHEADAMMALYESNKVISQKEFYRFVKKTMKTTSEE